MNEIQVKKRKKKREIMSYYRPDELYTMDGCDPCGTNACDPCGSNSCNPCGTNACDPCGPSGCEPCGPSTCGPCAPRCCDLDEQPRIGDCVWQVTLDMKCYEPEDIVVYAENNKLTVLAQKKHPAELFAISREFKREFEIPKDYNMDDVAVYFSCDCILVITISCVKRREYPIQPIGPARCFIMCCSDMCNNKSSGAGPNCTWQPAGKTN